jgi:hypothetical protein
VVDDECTVTEILHQIGVPAHIKGYQFLRDAILMTMENQDYINSVTKRLYPEIAKRNGTTASRVERAIRHAIEVAWDRGDVDKLFRLYDPQPAGQADEFGIHRHDSGQDAAGQKEPPHGVKTV